MYNILQVVILFAYLNSGHFYCKVVRVIDGDTIVVLVTQNEQIKIRLEGIDCPESDQDYGSRAKQVTSDLCFGKQVKIIQSGTDRYNRILAFVYIGDVCINEELLKQGMAWHYKKYNQDENLAQLEWTARNNKVGLWSMKNPIAPWDFRKL
jgi:endonuclease YncB( thermonuclease family)